MHVRADQPGGTISPDLFGANHRYTADGMGSYDPQTHSLYPRFVDDVRTTGVRLIRFPGGTVGNTYDWRRAVGPLNQRRPNILTDAAPDPGVFGPDEFGDLLTRVHASGDLVVNFGTGTPADAAAFVGYMTGSAGGVGRARATNGHRSSYPIDYVEVGNELDHANQRYWMSGTPLGSCRTVPCLYANGGSTRFSQQMVGGTAARTPAASISSGKPGQQFYAYYPPVQPSSVTVTVGGATWRRLSSLSSAGASAKAYTLDPATGRITFGDGRHGAVPAPGAPIRMSYVSGPHAGFNAFYQAIKAVAPQVRVCPALSTRPFLTIMGSSHPYDCVAVHPYLTDRGAPTGSVTAQAHLRRLVSRVTGPAQAVQQVRRTITAVAGSRAPSVQILVSEYGDQVPDPPNLTGFHVSMGEAILQAELLGGWVQLGIAASERQSLIDYILQPRPQGSRSLGLIDNALIAGPGPDTVVEPSGYVMALFSRLAGGRLVPSSAGTPPRLATVAGTTTDGHLYTVLTNPSPRQAVWVRITPAGFTASMATVSTLAASTVMATNTAANPSAVSVRTQQMTPGANTTYRIPPLAVVAVDLAPAH